jgi:hypothetical protein
MRFGAVDGDDAGAFAGERDGAGPPDAAARTGDEGDLVGEAKVVE